MSEVFVVVRKGDTFQGIALEHSTTVSALKNLNHIYGNNKLFVGQKLKIKESIPTSLLEASKAKIGLKTTPRSGSSGSIGRKSSGSGVGKGKQSTAPMGSVYDFIASSLWRSSPNKSTSSPDVNGSSSDKESLSDGFRPRASSGVGIEELESGEVVVSMPLTKSADFKTDKPQADTVVVEPEVEVKKRNENVQSCLKSAVLSNNSNVSLLSTEGNRLVDTEFDAELVEVNEHHFSSSNSKGVSGDGGSGCTSSTKQNMRRGGGLSRNRARTRSIVKVELHGDGCILTQPQAQAIAVYLPTILQANKWTLLYSVLNNGADLFSFYKLTKGANTTVLVVETMNGDVFGGFVNEQWHVDTSYYGGGESFVFRIDDSKTVKVFKWSMENHFVIWSNETQIAMGGGGDGFAFALDCDFYTGQSSSSATFNNEPLVASEDQCFQIKNAEVWKLDSCI